MPDPEKSAEVDNRWQMKVLSQRELGAIAKALF